MACLVLAAVEVMLAIIVVTLYQSSNSRAETNAGRVGAAPGESLSVDALTRQTGGRLQPAQ